MLRGAHDVDIIEIRQHGGGLVQDAKAGADSLEGARNKRGEKRRAERAALVNASGRIKGSGFRAVFAKTTHREINNKSINKHRNESERTYERRKNSQTPLLGVKYC